MNIGVLALQGGFKEHIHTLNNLNINNLNINAFEVRTNTDIANCDGLIIPGGESTTIGKLLIDLDLKDNLMKKILSKMPIFGTCAGLILLAKEIKDENPHMPLIDILVQRNAYGRQLGSFKVDGSFKGINKKIPMTFIRGPYITNCGSNVDILSKIDGKIVAARQENILVTSFHPELTSDLSVHQYFIDMVKTYLNNH